MTKPSDTTDLHKYIYSGHGIGFDRADQFTYPNRGTGRNVVILGADSSNSRHATNKTQTILVLGHGFVQKINNTTIYAEKMYSPNFSAENKAFCSSLHYNGDEIYLLMAKKSQNLKAKILKLKQTN